MSVFSVLHGSVPRLAASSTYLCPSAINIWLFSLTLDTCSQPPLISRWAAWVSNQLFSRTEGRGLFEWVTADFYLQNNLSEIDTKRLTAPEQMVWYVDKHVCLPLLANAYMPMKILVHPGFNNPLKSLGKSAGRLFSYCWGHMTQDRGVFYTGVGGSSLVGQNSQHCFKVLFCQAISLLWRKLLLSWKEWPLTLRCWWTLLSRGIGSPVLGRTLVVVWSFC